MIDILLDAFTAIDRVLWGPWTMVFIAGVAAYFTVRSRFFQVVRFPYITRNTIGKIFQRADDTNKHRITPFQATATSLAGTVGMGNMAGVATALSVGGPGAIFWMWVLALLGMMSKTAEITLAVHYRDVEEDGRTHGGPMHYIQKGLGWKFLALLFSGGILINSLFSASLLQAHTVGRALWVSYSFNPYIVTGLMAIVTAVVVLGGVKRIGQFSERLVPLMSALYLLGGLALLVVNIDQVPAVVGLIFQHAFSPVPAAGGVAGVAVAETIKQGMSRGMLSNEAGLGTAPMIHAAAETEHPFQQGLWGAFEVFFDTIIICSMTAFAILSTGVLSGDVSGIELVIAAFSAVFPVGLAEAGVSLCILTFCLSTQIGFFVYYETAIHTLFGPHAIKYLKWIYFLPGVLFAGVSNVDQLWVVANISVGVTALPNLVAMVVLSGVFFKLMKDYLSGERAYATAITDRTKKYLRAPKAEVERTRT